MIPINLIRQYKFCPRIPYYALLTNIKPFYPRHVRLGTDYHNLQNHLQKSRKFKKFGITFNEIIFDEYIEDEKLNICGKIDLAFLCDDEVIPVEFKNISKKPSYSHILQLVGYGLILKNLYKKSFKRVIIIYSNNMKFYKTDISIQNKNDFFKVLNSIENMLENDILPNSNADLEKCTQCEFINFCNDRF